MATATGRLKIGSHVYMTWPDPMRKLLDLDLIEADLAHAKPITFMLNERRDCFSEREIELILQTTTARSVTLSRPATHAPA